MMIVNIHRGTISLVIMCASSFGVLIVILLVPYTVVKGCTREKRGIDGISIYKLVRCGVLIGMINIFNPNKNQISSVELFLFLLR